MKKPSYAAFFCLIFVLILSGISEVYGQTVNLQRPLLENIYARKVTSLNGSWHRIVDPLETGYYDYRHKPSPNGFFKEPVVDNYFTFKEYDFDTSPTLFVPGDWNSQEAKLYYYEGTVWYKTGFRVNKSPKMRYYIYFGAVNYDAKVYLNGIKLGEHEGGYTPFNFDVTNLLTDSVNSLIVKADNKRREDGVPTVNFDWWNYGGITRDVMLVALPETFVEDYRIQLEPHSQNIISFYIKLNGPKAERQSVKVDIPELKIHTTQMTNDSGTVRFTMHSQPLLWSDKLPKLYDVCVSSGSDTITDHIGFRTIETRGNQILLNGKPVFLRGISIHEEAPFRSGRAYSPEDARTLLTWAKELGCNYVRLAHYPHNEYMVREAEKMGIMVWSEIPVYWTIDFSNPAVLQKAENQLSEMIQRDKNRSDIIIWSIANETPVSTERNLFLSKLSQYARSLDHSRLISMAMECTTKEDTLKYVQDEMSRYVDVISFNEYIGWYDGAYDKCDRVKWIIPYNKPIIISEFGGGAKQGYHGKQTTRWTEEYQAELYRRNLKMLEKIKGLSGMSPWILVDFRSPKRLLTGIQDDFNRKGLISDKGQKKEAWYVLKKWYITKSAENQ